jgi:hypothetical protein
MATKAVRTSFSKLTEETIRAKTKTGNTPLHRAAKTGRICEIPRHLLQTELFLIQNLDWQGKPHRTPLHVAAMYGHLDQVPLEFLTKETLTALDKYGKTPLHEAAGSGHANKIPAELLTPENLSIPEKLYGNTILHYLAWRNQLSTMPGKCLTPEMLGLKNYDGETPQQILEKYGFIHKTPKRHEPVANRLPLFVLSLVFYREPVCPHFTIERVKKAVKELDAIAPGWMENENRDEILLRKSAVLNPEWAEKEHWV